MSSLTQGLNREQSQAVTHPNVSLAVIAGAGSGKTKVLTHRIAFLMQENGWSSQNILAVTFTNKAAKEMRKRLQGLGIEDISSMWVGTFHGLAHRFLRRHHEEAGLSSSFTILDPQEQEKVLKKIIKADEMSFGTVDVKDALRFINDQKDAGLRPGNSPSSQAHDDDFNLQPIYYAYQEMCDKNSWVDFGELLLRAYEMLRDNEGLRIKYQKRFTHVLVDEFQDTNDIQYKWIELLCDSGSAIPATIVGDMDQSIYSWRGAKMQNVEKFIDEFAGATLIKLEQNYRSTHHILACANAVIQCNENRIDKMLWTQQNKGDPVTIFEGDSDKEEAKWAVRFLARTKEGPWENTAILYRSNAQSRIIEEACLRAGIPYKIHGGLRFFERAEIKDALAHMRLFSNINNDLMLERALTSPAKGFGAKTLENLRKEALRLSKSWAETLDDQDFAQNFLTPKLREMWAYCKDFWLTGKKQGASLSGVARLAVENSGLLDHYRKVDKKEGSDRSENLKEMISVAKRFQEGSYRVKNPLFLEEFLSSVALEQDVDAGSDDTKAQDALNLMTIHASKGLEFHSVCLVGWDEGLFPSSQSVDDLQRLEEERRLAYVAITRAEKHLAITGTLRRRQYGQWLELPPSRFFAELPSAHVGWASAPLRTHRRIVFQERNAPLNTSSPSRQSPSYWNTGDRVRHPDFGLGKIVRVDGLNRNDRVVVQFGTEKKTLLPQLAKLEKAE